MRGDDKRTISSGKKRKKWGDRTGFLMVFCVFLTGTMLSIQASGSIRQSCDSVRKAHERMLQSHTIPSIFLKDMETYPECFSPKEHLYSISIVITQQQMKPFYGTWYEHAGRENRMKAEDVCKILVSEPNPDSRKMHSCIDRHFSELMAPHEKRYVREYKHYIKERSGKAVEFAERCLSAFYQQLHRLPHHIEFPLAYYDKKLFSYPDWYVEKKQGNNAWLENMEESTASDIVRDMLGEFCPGDMIRWLYIPR